MSLRIRRGPSEDRVTLVFQAGELVYDTVEQRLYVGDGLTQGGLPITDLLGDASPQLGSDLDLNGNNILGFGNINIDGDITASGTLKVPNIVTDVTGSLFGDDSTPLVDGANNRLVLENNLLQDIGNVSVLPPVTGNILKYSNNQWQPFELVLNDIDRVNITNPTANDLIIYNGSQWINSPLTGDFTGDVIGNVTGNVIGDVIGNVTGNVVGDVVGSVYSTDGNTLVLDAVTNTFIGNVTGDIVGSVYSIDGSTLLLDALTNTFIGDVTGNVTGDVVCDNVTTNNLYVNSIYNRPYFYSNTLGFDNIATFVKETEVDDNLNRANITLIRKSTTLDLSSSIEANSTILFATEDTNGFTYKGVIGVHNDLMAFAVNSTGNFSDNNQIFLVDTGYFGIGTKTPTEKLQVEGNTKIAGFVQFGSYTTAERDDLTTTNTPQYATNWGMVIYNTDTNKFQGWQNTGGTTPEWVDLS